MGFLYGNTFNHIPRTNFNFSKIYCSRYALMNDSTDYKDVPVFGYVLINYSPSENQFAPIKKALLELKDEVAIDSDTYTKLLPYLNENMFEEILIPTSGDASLESAYITKYQFKAKNEETGEDYLELVKTIANSSPTELYIKHLTLDQNTYGLEYDEEGNVISNININFDHTVWQKVMIDDTYEFIAIARLHSVLPTFEYEGHYNIDLLEPMNMAGEYFGSGKVVWPPIEV